MGGMDLCVKLCNDCSTICDQHSVGLAKGDHSASASCISACEACATECEKGADHMDVCKTCAEACRACATACRNADETMAR